MFRSVQRLATNLVTDVTSLPLVELTPARRLGLGFAMLVDAQGETLLEFLGEDRHERAATLERILDTMTEEQLDELLAAFHEAAQRRALRAASRQGVDGVEQA